MKRFLIDDGICALKMGASKVRIVNQMSNTDFFLEEGYPESVEAIAKTALADLERAIEAFEGAIAEEKGGEKQ